jgi:type I restriction enzyme S subunit
MSVALLTRCQPRLPPLAEQIRIVAKVNELMAVWDRPEAQLTTVQSETSRLLDSVLHHTLNDNYSEIDKRSAAQA